MWSAAMILKIVTLEARSRIISRGIHVKIPADKRCGNQQWFWKLSEVSGIQTTYGGFGGGGPDKCWNAVKLHIVFQNLSTPGARLQTPNDSRNRVGLGLATGNDDRHVLHPDS